MKKKIAALLLAVMSAALMAGCSDADTVSENLSKDADQFKVNRRIVFFNGITDKYLLTIEGYCSLGNNDSAKKLSVTCDLGHGQYKKHILGLSDNVSFFMEQIDSKGVSKDHYKIIFKPQTIVPDIDKE